MDAYTRREVRVINSLAGTMRRAGASHRVQVWSLVGDFAVLQDAFGLLARNDADIDASARAIGPMDLNVRVGSFPFIRQGDFVAIDGRAAAAVTETNWAGDNLSLRFRAGQTDKPFSVRCVVDFNALLPKLLQVRTPGAALFGGRDDGRWLAFRREAEMLVADGVIGSHSGPGEADAVAAMREGRFEHFAWHVASDFFSHGDYDKWWEGCVSDLLPLTDDQDNPLTDDAGRVLYGAA